MRKQNFLKAPRLSRVITQPNRRKKEISKDSAKSREPPHKSCNRNCGALRRVHCVLFIFFIIIPSLEKRKKHASQKYKRNAYNCLAMHYTAIAFCDFNTRKKSFFHFFSSPTRSARPKKKQKFSIKTRNALFEGVFGPFVNAFFFRFVESPGHDLLCCALMYNAIRESPSG